MTDIHVSDSAVASDATGDGSMQAPYRSPQAGLDAVTANNDSVLLELGGAYFGNATYPAYTGITIGSYGSGALPTWIGDYCYKVNCLDVDEHFTLGTGRQENTGQIRNGRFEYGTSNWGGIVNDATGTMTVVTDHPAGSGADNAFKWVRGIGGSTLRLSTGSSFSRDQLFEISFDIYTTNGGKCSVDFYATDGYLTDSTTGDEYQTWAGGDVVIDALGEITDTDAWVHKSIKVRAPATKKDTNFRLNCISSSENGIVYVTNIVCRPLATNVSGNIWSLGWSVSNSQSPALSKDDFPLMNFTDKLRSTSVANPTAVMSFRHPHGYAASSTFTVTITGVVGGTYSGAINATHTATAIDEMSFSIPIECTVTGDVVDATYSSNDVNLTNQMRTSLPDGITGAIFYVYSTSNPTTAGYVPVYMGSSTNSGFRHIRFSGQAGGVVDGVDILALCGFTGIDLDGVGCKVINSSIRNSNRTASMTGNDTAIDNCSLISSTNYHAVLYGDDCRVTNCDIKRCIEQAEEGGGVWWTDAVRPVVEFNKFDDMVKYGVAWQATEVAGAVDARVRYNEFSDVTCAVWDQSNLDGATGCEVSYNYVHDPKPANQQWYSGADNTLDIGKSTAFYCYRPGNDTAFNNNYVNGTAHFACFAINPDAYTFTDNVAVGITDTYQRIQSSGSDLANIVWTNNMFGVDGAAKFGWWDGVSAIDYGNFAWWEATAGNNTDFGIDDPEIDSSLVVAETSPTIGAGTANTDTVDYQGNWIIGGPHIGAIGYVKNGDPTVRR